MKSTQHYRSEMINKVIDDLRFKIIDQTISRGAAMPENELSVQYGISRGSLRTALQFLEQEGLIKTLENGRRIVEGLTVKDVADIWNLRTKIECSAVKSIMHNKYADFLPIAQAISLINQYPANTKISVDQSIAIDMQMHRSILYACGNKPLIRTWEMFSRILAALLWLNARDLYNEEYLSSFWERHNPLLVGIMHDDERIIDSLVKHIERGKDICIDSIRRIENGAAHNSGEAGAYSIKIVERQQNSPADALVL